METTRRALLPIIPAALAATLMPSRAPGSEPQLAAEPDRMIDLWPDAAPGDLNPLREEVMEQRAASNAPSDRAIHGISRPRLAFFRPQIPNGAAAVIMPGGGYRRVVVDREGYEMAQWLRDRGFAAFVLFYRLPAEGWAAPGDVPLADAQRAMRLVKGMAGDGTIKATRVAALGFSAGGHACADLAARFATSCYDPVDASDQYSAKPFCVALSYPVVSMDPAIAHPGSRLRLIGRNPSREDEIAHSPDRMVARDTPPHFLVHAEDDRAVPVENTLRLRSALRQAGIATETHLFATGGHGFGLRRKADGRRANWPELWLQWVQCLGLVDRL